MPADSAFLHAIQANPDDDAPRLVYADWLDEHGDHDRAEFIRAQIELARLPEDDDRRTTLEWRERELLAAHEAEWLGPLPAGVREWAFRRGFLDEIALDAETFLGEGGPLFDRHPIRRVRVMPGQERFDVARRDPLLGRLASCPLLARVSALEVRAAGLGDRGVAAFADSRYVASLTSLDLSDNDIGPDGAAALARSPHLRHMETLWVNNFRQSGVQRLGDAGLAHLADERGLPRLRELWVGNGGITAEGLRRLVEGPRARGLTSLGLAANPLGEAGIRLLARARLGRLRELDVARVARDEGAFEALVSSPGLPSLERLDLGGCRLGERAARALAAGPLASRLTHLDLGEWRTPAYPAVQALTAGWPGDARLIRLDLGENWLGDESAAAVATASGLRRLRWLNLATSAVSDEGARALARSPVLGRLTTLHLTGARLGPAGARALMGSPDLRSLATVGFWASPVGDAVLSAFLEVGGPSLIGLGLGRTGLTSASARALAASPRLARLAYLDLSHNLIDPLALAALAESPYLPRTLELDTAGLTVDEPTCRLLRQRLGRRWSE
jgi:uncharacterized protein (TIGR02996 family)